MTISSRFRTFALKLGFLLLGLAFKPFILWLGYRRAFVQSLVPESHYYLGRSGFGALVSVHQHFLRSSGWLESVNLNSSFFHGDHRPWLTFPAINFLETMNLTESKVLEFGGGASTLYFSKRTRRLLTLEFDRDWSSALRTAMYGRANVEVIEPEIESGLLLAWATSSLNDADCEFSSDLEFESDAFVMFVKEKIFDADLVLIDGGPRNLAMVAASKFVAHSAIVIVDNSDRDNLNQGLTALREEGFTEIPMRGLGPINHYEWTTSFFFRDLDSVLFKK